MKILFANKFFFLNGGSETVFFQEREFLQSQGVEVFDFSMHDARNQASEQAAYFVGAANYKGGGGKLQKLKSAVSLLHSPEAVRKITTLIETVRPDILHCHNIYHQLTPSIIKAAHRLGVKTVLTLHDYKVVCPTYVRVRDGKACSDCIGGDFFNVVRHRCSDGSLGRSALLFAEAKLQQWMGSYDVLDRVIAPSAFMQRSVTQWRFPAEKVVLNYNGIDPLRFSAGGADEGYVLYLGRLSAEKGLLTLGQAQAASGVPVKVAGTGPLDETLRSRFPGLQLLGYQSGEPLRQLIAGASAIVVPSEWHENCPMSVLEAMACGKPVIGSRMGGIPELVQEGVTGRLFECGNVAELQACLSALMADADLRAAMGRAGRERLEQNYSLARHNSALLDTYKSLL
ncbi:glycosyltransferase family 4 protein [Viridibacterium curvum]|uniref:Glycosyltransferase family 4 protein n=1 Tax=Viridibacterium curvum TaxID=1101404 RepID=A0ABP9QZW8_9RHOO